MARTTQDAVEAIIDVDSSITDLTPFIDTASSLVDEVCATVSSYGAARLELIERWLAAHFYAVQDPRLASENVGGAGGSYQGQTTMNLSATIYGQQAMVLDTNGGLAALNTNVTKGRKPKVGVTWLGTESDTTEDE